MKKAIRMPVLALSLAATAGAAHAQSSVTLYGSLDMAVGYSHEGTKSSMTANSGSMTTSFFGIKGSEDLGNGYKAIFDMESFFRVDNGQTGRTTGTNEAFFSKQSLVGLQTPYGTVSAGKVGTPMATTMFITSPFGGSSTFDPVFRQMYSGTPTVLGSFAAGNGVNPRPGAGGGNDVIYDTTWNNSVMYTTPNFNGLTASVMVAPGEVAGKGGRFNIGANVLYFNGPLTVVASFERTSLGISNETAQVDGGSLAGWNGTLNTAASGAYLGEQSVGLIGGAYDLKFAKLFADYVYIYNDVTTPAKFSQSDQIFSIGATVPFGPGYFTTAWGHDSKQGATGRVNKGHRDMVSFAYNYPLSKRTDVYAAYRYDGWDNTGANYTTHLLATGIRHRF